MHRFQDYKNLVFSRRSFILLAGKITIILVLMSRLFFLQIIKSRHYKTLSEKNRIKFFLLEPRRGFVKDRNGNILAKNKINYQLYFYKQIKKEYEHTLSKIMDIVNMSPDEKKASLKEVKNSSYLYPTLIKDNLSWKEVTRIESGNEDLEGAYINKGYIRYYPLHHTFAHVVGYVGLPTEKEILEYQLQRLKGFRIGKTGVEKISNDLLIGEFGLKKVEVNAYRTIIRELDQEPSTRGKDTSITINSKLQNYVYKLLPADGAAAIVVDLQNGDVLSMVSKPSFDPNLFSAPINHENWNNLINNPNHPLTNRVTSENYPPGSVWKIITSLAILKSGISPTETVYCRGHTKVGTQTYKCWKEKGHGHITLGEAIRHSCNIYFYEMGITSGIDNINKTADLLGLGKKVGIELPGEVSGTNPGKAWKEKHFKKSWLVGDTANASIGQGYNLVTPLQLSQMISSVAIGKLIVPHIYPTAHTEFKDLDIDPKHLNIVRKYLEEIFNDPKGPGYKLRSKDPKLTISGKTGTAQVITGDTSKSSNKEIRSHSWFAGYTTAENPRYSAVVIGENAGWGMVTAGPIGVKILHFAQTKL